MELPYRLYRDVPHWVPPLRRDVAELIDPARHPFHQHATVELFLARDSGGRVVGRIAAIRNVLHEQVHAEPVGFFGLFESERNTNVAVALLNAAAEWLAERGLATMRGPASLSLNEECGLLVDGFDSDPMVMMPYNPPWYTELLAAGGLEPVKDLVAYERDTSPPPDRLVQLERTVAERYGVTVRPLDKRHFWDEIERIRDIYNSAWERNWGFVPMTKAEFDHVAKQMKPIADMDFVAFAEVHGVTAGFALALPDVNQALRHMNGRLLPFGWLKGLWHGRSIDAVRVLTLGILPKFRRTGAAEMLYLYLIRTARRKGLRHAEFSWILDDNLAIRTPMEKLGGRTYKTYRMYDRALRPASHPASHPSGLTVAQD